MWAGLPPTAAVEAACSVGRHSEAVVIARTTALQEPRQPLHVLEAFATAYRRLLAPMRSAWHAAEGGKGPGGAVHDVYVDRLAAEVRAVCAQAVELIVVVLRPAATGLREDVFLLKWIGDFWRYLAELSDSDTERAEAMRAYEAAALSSRQLGAADPLTLRIALNFSLFHYDICQSPDKACQLARVAYEAAESVLSESPEGRGEAAPILGQLRANLMRWTE